MKKTLLFLGAGLLFVALVSMTSLQFAGSPKLGYIDLPRVTAEFDMAKEFQSQLETEFQGNKHYLDSLKISLMNTQDMSDDERRYHYGQTLQSFEQQQNTRTAELNDQVMKKLNGYVRQFADEQGYDFVYGAEGSGVIMAANTKLDITDQVLQYINKKYQGQ